MREATLFLLLAMLAACPQGPHVVLHSAAGPVTVNVEVVNTPGTRARGLMYRRDLGADDGMLFVFPKEAEQQFWMKNTILSLDMIFIAGSGRIVGVVHDARPFSTESLGVGQASKYVLEVHGGFCAAHRIATGDRVEFVQIPDAAT